MCLLGMFPCASMMSHTPREGGGEGVRGRRLRESEGGTEGGREGVREGVREGGSEGEGWSEREGGREGGMEGGMDGGGEEREERREDGRRGGELYYKSSNLASSQKIIFPEDAKLEIKVTQILTQKEKTTPS